MWDTVEAAQPEIALDKEQMVPGSAYQDARSIGVSHCWVPLVTTRHSMPRANQYTIIDLVPPHKKIFKHIKIGTWKLSLGGGAKRELYLMDGLMSLNLSSLPKKGCLFGKSCVSHFVRCIPGNTLLTKALNHYFQLKFCRQWIYQRQSESVIPVTWINYLFQLCEIVSVKVLGRALTGKLNLTSGYTLNRLDINHKT